MSSKARITSEFPSSQEVASQLKLSSGRVAKLRKELYELHITHPDGSATIVDIRNARSSAKLGAPRKTERPARNRAVAKKR